MREFKLKVSEDMRLTCPQKILINSGDMNSVFFTVEQPEHLDGFLCRAEINMGGRKTFVFVTNRRFYLPPAASDNIRIQLVYGAERGVVIAKTDTLAGFVQPGVDYAKPHGHICADGITYLAETAFASVEEYSGGMIFRNLIGTPVAGYDLAAALDNIIHKSKFDSEDEAAEYSAVNNMAGSVVSVVNEDGTAAVYVVQSDSSLLPLASKADVEAETNSVNVTKLTQSTGDELILVCGSSVVQS